MPGVNGVVTDASTTFMAIVAILVIVFGLGIIKDVLFGETGYVTEKKNSKEWKSAKNHADWYEHMAENDELSSFERDVAKSKRNHLVKKWGKS